MIFGWKFTSPDGYCAYLDQGQIIEGVFVGSACEAFGVEEGSTVTSEAFKALQENQHVQTGKRLTKRQNKTRRGWEMRKGKLVETEVPNRVKFWDFTASLPKSFSILGIVGECPEVLDWHQKATTKAFKVMEQCTTHGDWKGGEYRTVRTGKFCAAQYTHLENRCGEPQIHSHLTIFNATPSEKGNYAIESKSWFDRCALFTSVYRDSLAASALQAGHRLEIDEFGAPQLAVISDCIKPYSQRSEDLNAMIDHIESVLGSTLDHSEKKRMVLASRGLDLGKFNILWAQERSGLELGYIGAKDAQNARSRLLGAATAIVRSCCEEDKVASIGIPVDPEQLARIRSLSVPKPALPPLAITPTGAIEWAIRHCFERHSVVPAYRLYAAALQYAMGANLDLDKLKAAASIHPELIHREGEITTRTHLAREEAVFGWIEEGKNQGVIIPKVSAPGLSEHQSYAINQLLSSPDQFTALIGKSGSGKTVSTDTLIRVNALIKSVNREHGYQVVVALAPSTKSRDVISHPDKHTLQRFLLDPQLQTLQPNDLVVLDEAGFASMEQVHDLMKLARKGQWRVCFVGDPRQHTSVDAGDAFRIMLDRTHLKREWLDKIIRQKEGAMKGLYLKAAKAFSQGQSTKGFAILDKAGAIEVVYGQERIERMADLIVAEQEAGRSVVAVNPSHRENDLVNEAVRKRLVLGEERQIAVHRSLGWTLAQRQQIGRLRPGLILEMTVGRDKGRAWQVVRVEPDKAFATSNGVTRVFSAGNAQAWQVCQQRTIPIAVGDWMVTHAAMKKTGNGEKFQVNGFGPSGLILTGSGGVVHTRNLSYAYAGTSHRSQGDTADTVIFGIDRHSVNWADLKLAYVASTRGRTKIAVFCESKADLIGIENRKGDRKSAVEMIKFCISRIVRKPAPEEVRLKVAA